MKHPVRVISHLVSGVRRETTVRFVAQIKFKMSFMVELMIFKLLNNNNRRNRNQWIQRTPADTTGYNQRQFRLTEIQKDVLVTELLWHRRGVSQLRVSLTKRLKVAKNSIGFCIRWHTYGVHRRQNSIKKTLNSVVFGPCKCVNRCKNLYIHLYDIFPSSDAFNKAEGGTA